MDIKEFKNKLSSLKGEQKQAAIDAIKSILAGRSLSPNSSGSLHPDKKTQLDIDPDLLIPTSKQNAQNNENQQPDFDDPDDIMNKRKFHGRSESDNNDKKSLDNNQKKTNSGNQKRAPQIGDKGDPNSDIRKAEDAYREANAYKDEAEEKAEAAEKDGDVEEANKQKELANKAANLADNANDLANKDELNAQEKIRLKKIHDALHDINIERKIQYETENAILTDRENQKRKKQQRKSGELNIKQGGLDAFKRSIDKFMKDQLSAKRAASWKRPNKRYPEESGIILKGKARVENKNIPLLVVYFDQSGSWDRHDVERGKAALESLNYYVKRHQLKLEIYYFAVNIHDTPEAARREGGTLAAGTLIDDIKRKRPNNVVIMTDSDPDRGELHSSVMVDGGVWLLFRDGRVSKDLYRGVRGKMLNEAFSI